MDEQLFNRFMESAKQAADISEEKMKASRTFTFLIFHEMIATLDKDSGGIEIIRAGKTTMSEDP